MKIKFNSDDNLPLNNSFIITIIIRSVFEEDGKYYPQVILGASLYELLMLEYDRIDNSEGIDVNKASESKGCDISQDWHFLDKNFKYEPYLCNGCHGLM